MKRVIFHPIIFAIYPIIAIYSLNISAVVVSDIFLPLTITIAISVALWLLLTIIYGNILRASIAVSFVLTLFFSYGHICNLIGGVSTYDFVIGRQRYLMIVWILLFIVGLFFINKIKNLQKFNEVINGVSIALVIISLMSVGYHIYRAANHKSMPSPIERSFADPDITGMANSDPKKLHNIYYIILDSYSANSTLKNVYQYENEQFTSNLENIGFYVAHKSTGNYPFTGPSLFSSLNMEYINFLAKIVGEESSDEDLLTRDLWNNNRVFKYLKSKGYRIITIHSSEEISTFQMLLIDTTILRVAEQYLMRGTFRKGVLRAFERLSKKPEGDKPHFIVAHILCPHPPFVFGPNGEQVGFFTGILGRINAYSLYIDQIQFINKKILQLMDNLLSSSDFPPIIIIQGDHGSAYLHSPFMHSKIPPDAGFLKAEMRILNAYYLPDGGKKLLYDTITPVNTFRIIFNYYLEGNYKLLEDKNYYVSHPEPYKFRDVTDQVKYAN